MRIVLGREARNSSSVPSLPFNSHVDLGQIISLLSFGAFFCGDNLGQMFPVGLSDPESEGLIHLRLANSWMKGYLCSAPWLFFLQSPTSSYWARPLLHSASLGTAHRLGSGLLSQSLSVLFLNGLTEEGHLKVCRIGQVVLISLSLTVGPHGVPLLVASSKHHWNPLCLRRGVLWVLSYLNLNNPRRNI